MNKQLKLFNLEPKKKETKKVHVTPQKWELPYERMKELANKFPDSFIHIAIYEN